MMPLLDAYLDRSGRVHVIFVAGFGDEATIYYSRADLSEAANARAWLEPRLVAENAKEPQTGRFYIDDEGKFNILFSGHQDGNGLYLTESIYQGTRSRPTQIFRPGRVTLSSRS
jgi:hypothetical protein